MLKNKDKSTIIGVVLYGSLLALYCLYDAMGFVSHDSPWLTPGIFCAFSTMIVVFVFRRRIGDLLQPHGRFIKPVICAALIVIAFYLLERPYNPSIASIPHYFTILNIGIIAALFCIVYFASQQSKTAAILFLAACFIAGLANYFVIEFKGQPVLPADLFALKTAASVGSGYTYAIDENVAKAYTMLAFACLLATFLPKTQIAPYRGFANIGIAFACTLVFGAWFIDNDIEKAYGCEVDVWSTQESYSQKGSLLCFLKRAQDLTPSAPAGYSQEAVEEILAAYTGSIFNGGGLEKPESSSARSAVHASYNACPIGEGFDTGSLSVLGETGTQRSLLPEDGDKGKPLTFKANDKTAPLSENNTDRVDAARVDAGKLNADNEQPAVIVIMNETFSDLTEYSILNDAYEGPSYYNAIADTAIKGNAYVSALGGGTCNSEFEFLTGSSMGSMGGGVYPYVLYDLDATENLAAYFKALGYKTTAIHPEDPTNWRRDVVYDQLGFDEFIDIDRFEDAERFRDKVADRETYRIILDQLATDNTPQFIFDVTMQNHGGYDTGTIPEELMLSASIDGVEYSELNEYISSIRQADSDLAYLIEGLEDLDRPIILCFFGDHQPGFADWLSSLEFGKDIAEFDLPEVQKRYTVPYMIWKNFDSDESSPKIDLLSGTLDSESDPLHGEESYDLSLNYLGSFLVRETGLPMTDYQKFLLAVQSLMPAINLNGYMDSEKVWHWIGEESAVSEVFHHYDLVQYDNLFNKSGGGSFSRFVAGIEQGSGQVMGQDIYLGSDQSPYQSS